MKEADLFPTQVVEKMRAHAIRAYPNEMAGYIFDGDYFELENMSPHPTVSAMVPISTLSPLIIEKRIDCYVHSHPNGPNYPSLPDMVGQIQMAMPFAIIATNGEACHAPFAWGAQLEPAPLLDRMFRHGVADCYAAVQDDFRINDGVKILDFPRSWDWFYHGEDMYEENFGKAGFVEIDAKDAVPGDCVLIKMPKMPVVGHAGRLHANGLIYHHPAVRGHGWQPAQRSVMTPIERYMKIKAIHKWVRYVG